MKYLKLHNLLWFLLVAVYALIEYICVLIYLVLYFIWNFKIKKGYWKSIHKAESELDDDWYGFAYEDNNVFETIIRRYKIKNTLFTK